MSIKVKDISKLYGQQKALDEVSFEINRGEIVGFLGPNGAGKSTMMKILTGYLSANQGEVFINDLLLSEHLIKLKSAIGYLPENNPLYLEMYIREFLTFVAKLYGVKNTSGRVEEMIELVGLTQEQHKKIGALSKGYRQRVGLAAAIIHDPDVLILDEPTTGLDPNQIVEIRNLIAHIGKNKTVLLSTHIMQEVEAMCNRAIIINQGEIVTDQSIENLKRNISDSRNFTVEFETPVILDDLLKHLKAVNVEELKPRKYRIASEKNEDLRNAIFSFAVKFNNPVLSLSEDEQSLEGVFKRLTGNLV